MAEFCTQQQDTLFWHGEPLAKLEGQVFDQMPVCFENVHIHRATILPKTGKINFLITVVLVCF